VLELDVGVAAQLANTVAPSIALSQRVELAEQGGARDLKHGEPRVSAQQERRVEAQAQVVPVSAALRVVAATDPGADTESYRAAQARSTWSAASVSSTSQRRSSPA
jgi:hypothetical protein